MVSTKIEEALARLMNHCVKLDDGRLALIVDNKFTGNIHNNLTASSEVVATDVHTKRIEAGKATIKELDVNIMHGSMSADTMHIISLSADRTDSDEINTTDLKSSKIDTEDIFGGSGEFESISAKEADFDSVEAESLSVASLNGISFNGFKDAVYSRLSKSELNIDKLKPRLSCAEAKNNEHSIMIKTLEKSFEIVMRENADLRRELSSVRKIAEQKPEVIETTKVVEKTDTVYNNFNLEQKEFSDVEEAMRRGDSTMSIDKLNRLVYTVNSKAYVIKGESI